MRTLRLVSSGGLARATLVDEKTRATVPDVLRLECAPLELHDSRWFATLTLHRRGPDGEFLYDADAQPVTDKEFVELVVGTIWEIA